LPGWTSRCRPRRLPRHRRSRRKVGRTCPGHPARMLTTPWPPGSRWPRSNRPLGPPTPPLKTLPSGRAGCPNTRCLQGPVTNRRVDAPVPHAPLRPRRQLLAQGGHGGQRLGVTSTGQIRVLSIVGAVGHHLSRGPRMVEHRLPSACNPDHRYCPLLRLAPPPSPIEQRCLAGFQTAARCCVEFYRRLGVPVPDSEHRPAAMCSCEC
jgi:hypothetical protein